MRRQGGSGPFREAERLLIRRSLWPGVGGRAIALVAAIGAIGVMIGVASLVLVVSVMNAAEVRLASQVGGVDGHLSITRVGHQLPDWRRVRSIAATVPGVEVAVPSVVAPVMASADGRAFAAELQGVRRPDMERLISTRSAAVSGHLPTSAGEAALGADLATRLGLMVGSPLTVSAVTAGTDGMIRVREVGVRVSGIVDSGAAGFDARRIVVPLANAASILGERAVVSRIDVRLVDPGLADAAAAGMRRRLPGHLVRTWQQLNASMVAALRTEKVAMATIVSIVTLVALFNIAGSLIMLVRFRTREIAILRTMGMTRGAIARVYMAIGATIGLVGGATGLALGLGLVLVKDRLVGLVLAHLSRPSVEMRVLLELPLTISGTEVGWIGGLVGAGVLGSTLWPALRAASVEPAVVLRGS